MQCVINHFNWESASARPSYWQHLYLFHTHSSTLTWLVSITMSHLLDPATIPEQPQDLIQQWTLRDLTLATATTEDSVKFLAKRKLLANSSTCEACNRLRNVHQDHSKTDNMLWECPNHQCRSKKSVQHGSLFSESQLSLTKLITFIYRLLGRRVSTVLLQQGVWWHGKTHSNSLGAHVSRCLWGLADCPLHSNWRHHHWWQS